MRNFTRSNDTLSDAEDDHGPRQLFRAAMCPSCFSRQLRVAPVADASRDCIPAAIVGSTPVAVGENTNARSFEYPSPFTSPAIIGVNAEPERNVPVQLTWTAFMNV